MLDFTPDSVLLYPISLEERMGTGQDRKSIDVAIVGGGIGGLALAIGLQQHAHIRTKIYEAASKFSEIGGELQHCLMQRMMMTWMFWCLYTC